MEAGTAAVADSGSAFCGACCASAANGSDASMPMARHCSSVMFFSKSMKRTCKGTLPMREVQGGGQATTVAPDFRVDQARMCLGGRSRPPRVSPVASEAGETVTISEPVKAGVALNNTDGGAAAPMQVAVQALQLA